MDGLFAGAVAGLIGGLPSTLALTLPELDRSVRSIAHLVPGNSHLTSRWSRRVAGAATHMAISLSGSVLYSCWARRRLPKPSFIGAAAFGVALWAVDIKLLAPQPMLDEDPSLKLPDHLCWAVVVEMCLRKRAARRGEPE
ncbi:MAG TPA: hypothetical protein VFV09_07350 [Actinomycetota bacterium]|nr:hypothetical protein [Actinomycetota bacterium]